MECPVCGTHLYLDLVPTENDPASAERRDRWIDAITKAELREAQKDEGP
jgi:hypothetical protein